MSKNNKKHFASMDPRNNEKGFTFIHLLLAITILTISLPFLSYLLQAASYQNDYSEISVQQFFQYMRNEVISAVDYRIRSNPPTLYLELENGNTAAFEQYGSLIRRQIDGTGHEIYLRDVSQVQFVKLDYGFQLIIATTEGDIYEKSFVFYE